MRFRPLHQRSKSPGGSASDGISYILRLSSLTMRRHYQPPGDFVRNFRAVIAAHYVQTKIDPRGATGGSQNVALIYIQDVRLDANLGKTRHQSIDITPVSRRALPIEQSSSSQHEYPGADGNQARTLGMRLAQRTQE